MSFSLMSKFQDRHAHIAFRFVLFIRIQFLMRRIVIACIFHLVHFVLSDAYFSPTEHEFTLKNKQPMEQNTKS
ncbi:hypothetical protein CEQ28_018040 [Hafnia alvei]|nr:hypothetical protein A6V27_15635 [Hafnia alvei]KID01387.1 hypothetical protein PU00_15510 [Hafnia alvei]PNK99340.1 hypothetical protein CEQ28_018040 [Hafnia alvei]